ncbi:MAG: multidrug effflux MFS transporter [Thermoleophilia bacterium]|nr:multidrug effflux MFS transporter [Thermoleophilia bacterium]
MDQPSRFVDFSSGRRAGIILILGGLWTIGSFATDLYLPAMPATASDLGASAQAVALSVTTFLIGLSFGQLLAGPLSDIYGRRRTLLAGLLVFTVSALVCVFAPSVEMLIAVRFIQGVAGAFGLAIPSAIITDYSRGRDAARLFSRVAFIGGVAPIVAPLLGAQLLIRSGWRGPFVAMTVIGLILTASVAIGLSESLPQGKRSARGLSPALRSMAMLSRDVDFMGYTVTTALVFVAFFTYLTGSSFVYQEVYGVSATFYSVLFAVNAVGMLAATQVNHRLLARFSPRQLLAAALMADAAAGATLLAVVLIGGLGIWAFAAPIFVLVTSLGFIYANSTALALSLHPEVAGSAAAYFGTMRLGLGALATPLVALGGTVSAFPMALMIALSLVAALALFAVIARRTRDQPVLLDLPEEASADVPVA